jgi:two-component system NtrC family sensor kinase
VSEHGGPKGAGGDAINTPQTSDRIRELQAQVERLSARVRTLQREQELWVRVEKEAAVGRLARGVAHEINNPLQGVLGFVQLLIRKVKAHELDEDQALQSLEWIEASALRCKRIVDALLDFSAREEARPRVVDVIGLLELNLVLLRHELTAKRARLETMLPPQPIPVEGDPGQLTQALFNVLANARDAVGDGGRIRVEVALDPERVIVAVSDDGPGIPAEDLNRIFDPFFSTKEVGQGTGLGLCAARGIARVHGGDIRVAEAEAGGTRIELELPRHAAAAPAPAG